MAVVGEATIKLNYDAKSGKASLESAKKEAQSGLSKMQKDVLRIGGKVATAATVAVASGITAIAGESIKQFAEFEQISGGIQKIFDEMDYSVIEKDANDAWKSMNISANEYMKQISGVGAIFAQTMGDKKGYETAKTGMQAIADYASGTGASVDELMGKFQMISRSTTSYQSIADQFAGILPQTTKDFLAQAQSAGFLSKEYEKLNDVPVAEYQEAIAKMLEKGVDNMGLLGNTAEETEGTISGSLNAAKASWQNVVTSFVSGGKNLDKALDAFGDNVMNLAGQVIPKFIDAFGNIIQKLGEKIPQIISFLVQMALKIVQAIVPQLPTIFVQLINGIIQLFVELSKPENLLILQEAMLALLKGLVMAIPQIIDALAEALPEIIANLVAFLCDPANIAMMIDGAITLFGALVMAVPKILSALTTAFVNLFVKLWQKLKTTFTDFGAKFGQKMGDVFKNAVNGVLGFIEGFINSPIDAINGLIGVINEVPGIDIPMLGRLNLPRLAKGGLITGSTIANIGEAGDEAVIPLERNTENWAQPLASAIAEQFREQNVAGAGVTVYMTNNINNNLDADEIGQRLMTSIRRAS